VAIGNREVNTMSAGESFSANILKVDFAEEFPKKKIMTVLVHMYYIHVVPGALSDLRAVKKEHFGIHHLPEEILSLNSSIT